MRILEARFHPHSKAHGGSVVIGRVACDDGRMSVELAGVSDRQVQPFSLPAVIDKLLFLVDPATPEAFELLRHFRSDFWSFEELDPEPDRPLTGGTAMRL